jgi:hypothetical protein
VRLVGAVTTVEPFEVMTDLKEKVPALVNIIVGNKIDLTDQ